MRTLALAACAALTTSTLAEIPKYSPELFYDTVSIFGSSFNHDESKILITTDASGVFNVYSQPVAGGEPTQLTFSEDSPRFGVSFFPSDDRFLYSADQGGNELNHVYVQSPDGTVTDLTPGDTLKAQFAGWAGDLDHFYIATNERDPKFFDIYKYDATDYQRSMIFENVDAYSPGGVSRDGRWLSLTKTNNNSDSDVFLVDLDADDQSPVLVTEHEGFISFATSGFSNDSSTLYLSSNEGSEWNRIWAYNMVTGDKSIELEADWDIFGIGHSWDGRYRQWAINNDARTDVFVKDLQTDKPLDLPEMPAADITGINFSRSGNLMAFYVNGATSPSNLFVMDLNSGSYTQLTDSMNPMIDQSHLVNAEVVRFPSFDGLDIPSLLYKPHGASAENPAPVMLWIHGGPGGQTRIGYSANIQALVNHGYAVFAVNNRGSSGYGKTFFHLDDRKHGDDDLMDCVYGKRWLETQDWVDADKIGIMGGSYGGYMTAAAMTYHPDEFAVGINIFGVTNWLRTLESIPAWWESFRESLYDEMGDPATDRERLHRISPLFHASNVKNPVMVIQGANDPRVLQVESDELVEAIRANGVPVEYILFPDEGHGFRSKANRITALSGYIDFLDRYLSSPDHE
ncbi:MAG: S9 family peptidase [Planctomycetota bacterium]|jgi:prolyl oligopeptidase